MTLPRSLSVEQLRASWPRFAPPAVAACTWPQLLTTSGTLVVEAAGPWLAELDRRAPELLAALPPIDGNRVERIRFVQQAPGPASARAKARSMIGRSRA